MHAEPTINRAHVGGPGGAMDRLSALPDSLLHAVMYFLPAPEVVQTCLLSRQWRDLWRSTPCLNIEARDFGISQSISHGALEQKWERFEDFTTNLLLFHDNTSSLGEFRFSSCVYKKHHVDRWIRRGIEYCPAVLQIQIFGSGHGHFKLPSVASSSYYRLRTLCLSNVDLDSHFADLLCSSCPVLETLELNVREIYDNCFQGITSPTLNKLVLVRCVNKTSNPLVITAPSLAHLSLKYGCYQSGISLCKMESLVEASIHIIQKATLSQKSQRELLGSLFNVTRLELMGFEAEVMLNEMSDTFPIFCSMQTLHLRYCFLNEYDLNDKLDALGSFCQNAPCLEKLTLEYCMFYSFSAVEWEVEQRTITLQNQDRKTFQCSRLKLIEVIYDYDHDHQLIELLWSLAKSLPDASIKLKKIE